MESMIAVKDKVWAGVRCIIGASEARKQQRKQNYRVLVGRYSSIHL
jgi:hypothetical protein